MGLFSSQIPIKRMMPLCRQIATSYDAGIPIMQTMDLVSHQTKDRQIRTMLTDMRESLRKGSTLAEAAQDQSKRISPLFINLLACGEHGGKLNVVLNDLSDYYEDRLEMRRVIVRSVAYPILVLIMGWFLGTFALRLITQIVGIFGQRGTTFSLEKYFMEYALFQAKFLGVFGIAFIICVILSRLGLFKWIGGAITTRIWPLSTVTRKFALARFFRSMSLLIESGVDMMTCIRSSAATIANPYIERDLLKAVPEVKMGMTLDEAFAGSRFLTPTAREMIIIGEQSGNLDVALRKVSDYHMSEATHAVKVATTVFSTLLVLAVAMLIGYIVILFWTRLYGGLFDELGV